MKAFAKVKERRGGTAVEFALVLPLFAMLMLSIIDFGHYFFIEHTVQYATREGTRLALVGGQINDSKNTPMSRLASIIQTIQDNASMAVDPAALQISIYPVPYGTYDDPKPKNTQDPGNGGDYMRVDVQYVYHFYTPMISQFFPSGQQLIEARALYRNESF
jgi:Flp pilus assembly protein TadG